MSRKRKRLSKAAHALSVAVAQRAVCERKRAFRLKVMAEVKALALMNHRDKKRRPKVPLHTYLCPVCKSWHLTKRPQA